MGRRSRHRDQPAPPSPKATAARMARVQVSDDTWVAFRASLGMTPVSVGLGRLVEREVASYHRRTSSEPDALQAAVADARRVADELRQLIERVEDAGGGTERDRSALQ